MSEAATAVDVGTSEDARLESLGYKPQLNRVLGFFSNFAVGFTYLSPMVGIYSLFVLGVGIAGPAYIWLTFIPLIGMLFVALVFGELASHYPVAGALFQYSKFYVGPGFGWFVGWFYGFALLITVAAVDTGVVPYVTALLPQLVRHSNLEPDRPRDDPRSSRSILLAIQIDGEHHRRPDHGATSRSSASTSRSSARSGSRSSSASTASTTASASSSPRRAPSTQRPTRSASTSTGAGSRPPSSRCSRRSTSSTASSRRGHRRGDEGRRPADPEGDAPRADLGRGRFAHPHGRAAARDAEARIRSAPTVAAAVSRSILAQLPSGLQDFLLLLIIFAFFSCGSSIQGAGSRLAFSYARDGALPGSGWISRVNQRFKTPVNALLMGAVITVLFCLLVYINPGSNYHIGFITYPAHVNASCRARLVRRQRHLPVVPPDGDRGDHRPAPAAGSPRARSV